MFARHVSSLVILNNVNKKLCRNQDSNLGYYGTVVRCDPQRRVLTTRRLRLTDIKHFLFEKLTNAFFYYLNISGPQSIISLSK